MRKVKRTSMKPITPEQFRAIRERLGSQESVAAGMGVSRKTLACWEIGYHPIPRMAVILLGFLEREAAQQLIQRAPGPLEIQVQPDRKAPEPPAPRGRRAAGRRERNPSGS